MSSQSLAMEAWTAYPEAREAWTACLAIHPGFYVASRSTLLIEIQPRSLL